MGKATIDRAVLALHRLADKNDGRPALTNIFRNAGSFAAANGFVAGRVQHDDEKHGEIPQTFRIPAKAAKQIKTSPKHPRIAVDITDDTALIASDASPWSRMALDVSPAPYQGPDLRTIVRPSADVPRAVVRLDAQLLRQVADFLNAATAGAPTRPVEMRIYEPGQAIEFRSLSEEKSEVTALLMPLVVEDRWMFDPVDGIEKPSECEQRRFGQYIANAREQVTDDKEAA
jgi:hypothetical protein